ncbi:MAG: flagellar export chaperone FlgN [Candidatus Schekmanbacteria bacterium]|nr:flagellar export chaperone FlgN [Candidatus Schekmanbacteria bacterium]
MIKMESFSNLATVLEELVIEYGELLVSLEKLSGSLCSSSTNVFMESQKRVETIVLKIKLLEELRLKHVRTICLSLEIEEDTLSLQTLSQMVPVLSRRFLSIRERLNEVVSKLSESIKHISKILESSIITIENTLNFIKSLCTVNPIYKKSGKIETGERSMSFITQKI